MTTRVVPIKDDCWHHHMNSGNVVGKPTYCAVTDLNERSAPPAPMAAPSLRGNNLWVWLPSWHELCNHYFQELGSLACSLQMLAMTVFCISGIAALPPIFTALDTKAKLDAAFWAPQVVGGIGFTLTGILFMVETQTYWWRPAPKILGWHIAAWNTAGGVGFTLCGVFGLLGAKHWAQYQASCSAFWGSWAFLIGSTIQW